MARMKRSRAFNVFRRMDLIKFMYGILRRRIHHRRQGLELMSTQALNRRLRRNRQVLSSQGTRRGAITLLCRLMVRRSFRGPLISTTRRTIFFHRFSRVMYYWGNSRFAGGHPGHESSLRVFVGSTKSCTLAVTRCLLRSRGWARGDSS